MYDTQSEIIDNIDKMKKAWDNESWEKEMREEIKQTVQGFLFHTKYKETTLGAPVQNFLMEEANKLAIMRATCGMDWSRNELINDIVPESPTRLIKQFKQIWIALKSLSPDYPDEKCKRIIKRIVYSSANTNRIKIYEFFKQKPLDEYKLKDIEMKLRLGRRAVKTECEILWNLGILKKETKEERVNARVYTDDSGVEHLTGGYLREIDYYSFDKDILPSSVST